MRPGRWGAEKANAKGHFCLEFGAALPFVRARLWVPLLQTMGGKQVDTGLGELNGSCVVGGLCVNVQGGMEGELLERAVIVAGIVRSTHQGGQAGYPRVAQNPVEPHVD